jgi:trimethylamine--corrinoid protein Co-methyltransferase
MMEAIDATSYRMLSEVGAFVELDDTINKAKEIGCEVDPAKKIVKFPEYVVKEQLKRAPRNFFLAARDPKNDVIFEGASRRTYIMAGHSATMVQEWDENSKEYTFRDATLQDAMHSCKIMDALDGVDFLFAPPLEDTVASKAGLLGGITVHELYAELTSITKHGGAKSSATNVGEWDYLAKMAAEVLGGLDEVRKRPLFRSHPIGPGPLQIPKVACWNFIGAAKYGIPYAALNPAPAPGITTPMTSAGAVVVAHAGTLAYCTLAEAYNPGVAIIPNAAIPPISLRYGTVVATAPVYFIGAGSLVQIWHEMYGLPRMSVYGYVSKEPDMQYMYEVALAVALSTLYGMDAMQAVGFTFDAECTEACVMAEEMVRYVKHMMSRFGDLAPTEENLAYDVIKEAGPMGTTMKSRHTISHMNLEYNPMLADYRPLAMYLKDRRTMWDNVRKRAKELEKHEVPALPTDVDERLRALMKEADEKYRRVH